MSDVYFDIDFSGVTTPGEPVYVAQDYAFNFWTSAEAGTRPAVKGGSTSLLIGMLELEVAIENLICLYPWGYCPWQGWKISSLSIPTARGGSLIARCGRGLQQGVSMKIPNLINPVPWFDTESGWFCMEQAEVGAGQNISVEFATGCVAIVTNRQLTSLWIKARNWADVAAQWR